MIKDIINDTIHRMDQAVAHTRTEMSKVRTGRANTELVESIKISYYGTLTPLNQLSTISIPEPRLITIHPFDKSVIDEIEKAIMESNLGLTPNNNGEIILVPIPPLSEERRIDLTKYVQALLLKSKIKNIDILNIDTFDVKNKFFSARRALKQKHNDYGRNISIIMIK